MTQARVYNLRKEITKKQIELHPFEIKKKKKIENENE